MKDLFYPIYSGFFCRTIPCTICLVIAGQLVSEPAHAQSPATTPVESISENKAPTDLAAKEDWKRSIAAGFNFTRGNADTSLLTVGVDLAKEKSSDIYTIDFDL